MSKTIENLESVESVDCTDCANCPAAANCGDPIDHPDHPEFPTEVTITLRAANSAAHITCEVTPLEKKVLYNLLANSPEFTLCDGDLATTARSTEAESDTEHLSHHHSSHTSPSTYSCQKKAHSEREQPATIFPTAITKQT